MRSKKDYLKAVQEWFDNTKGVFELAKIDVAKYRYTASSLSELREQWKFLNGDMSNAIRSFNRVYKQYDRHAWEQLALINPNHVDIKSLRKETSHIKTVWSQRPQWEKEED